jgi:hypothetical protein
MAETLLLDRVLALPASDIKALQEGRTIAALPIAQTQKGWSFILYPHSEGESLRDIKLETWATCANLKMIHAVEQLSTLSALALWSQAALEKLFEERGHLSLALLRAYQLPKPITISGKTASGIKLGKFVGLSHFDKEAFKESVRITEILPILSETVFANRHRQMTNFCPPEHPNLETLQTAIAQHIQTNPEAQVFDHDLRVFLGWADRPVATAPIAEWITEITTSGNSSNGDLFEKRVRQGFVYLGFTNTLSNIKASLAPDATGGAGGLDIYCEKPFSIVGECKASKQESVPNSVSAQLIHLGITHLGRDQFEASIKIIFAAGKLTDHAEKAAVENHMNIMRPETLQRLVELKAAHPGSIDLLELKPCLETAPFGTDADAKVNEFINRIWQKIKVRLHIIQSVKELKKDGDEFVSASTVRIHFNTVFARQLQERLDTTEQAHSLLIELSSPLTGYLGSTKGSTWQDDRFYFLRDLTG